MKIFLCNLCGAPKPCIKIQDARMDKPRVCTLQKIPLKSAPALRAKWEQIDKLPDGLI